MSVDANALERETLERKDRDELQKIAGALGGKVTSRTRKADIIDLILELTGVTGDSSEDSSKDDAAADQAGSEGKQGGSEGSKNSKDDAADENGKDEGSADSGGRGQKSKRDASAKADTAQSDAGKSDAAKSDAGKSGASGKADDDQAGKESGDAEADTKSIDGDEGEGGRRRRRRGRNRDSGPSQDEFTGEPIPVSGVLDLRDDGYGFLRVDGLLPSKDDCYVSVKQVRQFGLRKGDVVAGGSRPAFRNEKNPAILRIDTVNEVELEPGTERPLFEELTPVFPTELLELAVEGDAENLTPRAIDLLAPIGKGSRVLLASPPRTGATTILESIIRSVEANEPDVQLVVVLLDERPEEITEMERLVAAGTVHGSAFDADPDAHVAVLELALSRAKRMAEAGDDVVVLVDGLTRIARAAHAAGQGSSRTVGGIDVGALQTAKRAFGAGRNLEDGGSITMVATVTVDTGSEVDDAVHDAVRGAATTQIRLDRFAAERRSFPALDVGRTSTRREELLVGDDAADQREVLRRVLAALPDADSADHADGLDTLIRRLRDTPTNAELLEAMAKEEKSR